MWGIAEDDFGLRKCSPSDEKNDVEAVIQNPNKILDFHSLKTEATYSSELSVHLCCMCHIPEDCILRRHCLGHFRSKQSGQITLNH